MLEFSTVLPAPSRTINGWMSVVYTYRRSDSLRDSSADDDDAANIAAEIFVKPIFHKTPTNLEVAEGQTARLDSIVIGRPNPEIIWYHNGRQVLSDRTHKMVVNQDGVNSLIFQPVDLSDSGSYRCVAWNGGGEESFEVSVNVTRKWHLLCCITIDVIIVVALSALILAKIFPATTPSCSTDCELVILVSLTHTY